MDYNDYVSPDQYLAQQSEDQAEGQYVVIHSGGPGLSQEDFVMPTDSDNQMNDVGNEERVIFSHLGVLEYCEEGVEIKKEAEEEEEEEGEEEEEEKEDDDDYQQEELDDILRNVMRVQGIDSLSPTTSDMDDNSPLQARRHPLSEKQSHNVNTSRPGITSHLKPVVHAKLPTGFSYKFAEKESDSITGVMSQRVIDKGQWFGPYNGSLLNEREGKVIGSTWELCLRGAVSFYLDGRNKIHNNWLYHINPARTTKEQNLEAFQHYGDIYFRALDIIQPGTELKVFFSDEYRVRIGCKIKLDDLNYVKDADEFQCTECDARYKASKSMLRHIKFTHDHEKRPTVPLIPRQSRSRQIIKESDSTASDQLMQLAKHVRAESTCQKNLKRSSKRTVTRGSLTKRPHFRRLVGNTPSNGSASRRSLIMKNGERNILGNTLSHDRKLPISSNSRILTQKTLTQDSTTQQDKMLLSRQVANLARTEDHICLTCGKSFANEGMLVSHQLFHRTTISEFRCEVCGLAFKIFQDYIRHKNTHAKLLHNCFLCENKYRYKSSYTRHLTNAHHIQKCREKYTCRLCGLSVIGKTSMATHRTNCTQQQKPEGRKDIEELEWTREEAEERSAAMKGSHQDSSHHGPNKEMGKEYDGWIVEDSEDLGSEEEESGSIDSDSDTQDYDGTSASDSQNTKPAQKSSSTQGAVDMLGRHPGYFDKPRPFRCKFKSCHKSYSKAEYLSRHINNCHQQNKNPKETKSNFHLYKCEQCPRTFGSEAACINHKADHTGAKPFKCDQCLSCFRTRRLLSAHKLRIHTVREKKHKCAQCGKKFYEMHCLRYHERRHRGERNFQCEICEKGFTTKDSLQKHMVIHTGEKPFACNICDKKFSLNLYLVRHAQIHLSDNANKRHGEDDE